MRLRETNEEKQQYITEYYKHEGVQLDINNISKNPGLRAVIKMLLNSHRGRFAMNTNKIQYKIV